MSRLFKREHAENLSGAEIAEREEMGYRLLPDNDGSFREADLTTKKGIQTELTLTLAELIPAAVYHNNLIAAGALRDGQATRLNNRVHHITEIVRVALEFNAALIQKWTTPDGFVRATAGYLKGKSVDLQPLSVMMGQMDSLTHNTLSTSTVDKAFGYYLLPDGSGKVKAGSKSECAMTYVQLKSTVQTVKQYLDVCTKKAAVKKSGIYNEVREYLSPFEVFAEREKEAIAARAATFGP
ncbi:MAG: hypothetical protein P1U40_03720 [Coxiellaceae bacterium]|nr:hypothetical protein [Coxiellaceae bacterium]